MEPTKDPTDIPTKKPTSSPVQQMKPSPPLLHLAPPNALLLDLPAHPRSFSWENEQWGLVKLISTHPTQLHQVMLDRMVIITMMNPLTISQSLPWVVSSFKKKAWLRLKPRFMLGVLVAFICTMHQTTRRPILTFGQGADQSVRQLAHD